MPAQVFRAGVVLVVRRDDGDLLAFERADVRGAWQLPQGGLDVGEEPLAAAWRELEEETGLGHSDVRLVHELPEWIAYEWPEDIRARVDDGGRRRGQIQKWFLFGVPPGAEIRPRPDGVEFSGWQWMSPQQIMAGLPEFRRDCYGRAFARILP